MPRRTPFAGAVLCGGASVRMGRDKAAIEIDGQTMVRRVADALVGAGATDTFAVGGRSTIDPSLRWVDDLWPGEGPLGGVITGLLEARRLTPKVGSAAVLACDLLHPDAPTIRRLVDLHVEGDVDATVPVVDGRRQWTHAIWATRCIDVLSRVFESGERSIVGATAGLRVAWIDDVRADATDDADVPGDLPRESPAHGSDHLPGARRA